MSLGIAGRRQARHEGPRRPEVGRRGARSCLGRDLMSLVLGFSNRSGRRSMELSRRIPFSMLYCVRDKPQLVDCSPRGKLYDVDSQHFEPLLKLAHLKKPGIVLVTPIQDLLTEKKHGLLLEGVV